MARLIFAGSEFILSGLTALGVGWFAPVNFYEKGADALIALLAITMGAVLPAMMLAGTSLRAGRFSVHRVRSLGDALDRQIRAFGGLFALALAAATSLVIGRLLGWPSIPIDLEVGTSLVSVQLGKAANAVVTFLLTLVLLRAFSVVTGVRSIQRLTANIAEDEAIEREQAVAARDREDLEGYQNPTGYGSYVQRPH